MKKILKIKNLLKIILNINSKSTMALLSFDTLTAATQRARNRPPNTIALILGLEGARYYLFFSQPSISQLMNRMAAQKVRVAMEIEHHAQNLPDNEHLVIREAARLEATPSAHAVRKARAAQLIPYLVAEAEARGVDQSAGHAETIMILSWRACVLDFFSHTGRRPRKGDIFLTHSPCRSCDKSPSPELEDDGFMYPKSCRSKLYTFIKKNNSVHWKIYYALPFGSAEAMTDEELSQDFPGISIQRMPSDILLMFTQPPLKNPATRMNARFQGNSQ